jgi:hypothetical protein
MLAVWLWARVVQGRLDCLLNENAVHRIRKQKKVLLLTGGRIEDFYNNPEAWGGKDMLISVDQDDVNRLLNRLLTEHTPQRLFQFGTDESDALATELFRQLGSPELDVKNTWRVWKAMMDFLNQASHAAEV